MSWRVLGKVRIILVSLPLVIDWHKDIHVVCHQCVMSGRAGCQSPVAAFAEIVGNINSKFPSNYQSGPSGQPLYVFMFV